MERDVLRALGMTERGQAVAFLKRLWAQQPTPCPKCGRTLELLHKRAKKSNCDWKCPGCGVIYRTIHILDALNEK